MNILRFKTDTKHRKQWFTGVSFSHPAKMSLPLQLWLIENFTKEGETILDPMSGSGTVLVACSMGRNVIAVELESKFIDIMKGNWEKIKQRGAMLGSVMGNCQILQGDARNLEGLLADKIITSPPYSDISMGGGLNTKPSREGHNDQSGRNSGTPSQAGAGKYDKIITSPPYASGGTKADENPENYIRREEERLKLFPMRPKTFVGRYSGDRENIGNLPYGEVDKIITSPPYAGRNEHRLGYPHEEKDIGRGYKSIGYREGYGGNPDNLGNLPYGQIDKIITSPPYEEAMGDKHHSPVADKIFHDKGLGVYTDRVDSIITSPPYEGSLQGEEDYMVKKQEKLRELGYERKDIGLLRSTHSITQGEQYSKADNNIGNLKSTSYLEAMLAVYKSCYAVLKDGGLLILVTKNFIRNQKEIRLDLDTIRLCEQAGFTFKERWYRELPAQSFWRIIYKKKYPDAPELKYEDVLVFSRG